MTYKIIFYQGDSIDIKTEFLTGTATVGDGELLISGAKTISINFADLQHIQLFRHYGLCRMLNIKHSGGTLFLAVIRLRPFHLPILGQFCLVNFFKTGELHKALQRQCLDQTLVRTN